ncbi:MAG: hypothetical protein WA172_16150 [Terriglobales bacterium]
MLGKMMDAVFGCRHSRYSFPLTIRAGSRRATPVARIGTYVVCLDCGREFAYDWQEMRVADSHSKKTARSLVTKEAA